MRLLDQIAQCTAPFLLCRSNGDLYRLTGAFDFAQRIEECPLRYVLSDGLVETCVALAYSEGERLWGCLDLIRIPAEQLWVEWSDERRRAEVVRSLSLSADGCTGERILRAGTLIRSDAVGLAGSLRTFWVTSERPNDPILSPVETLLDLNGQRTAETPAAFLEGKPVALESAGDAEMGGVLQYVRFKLDATWQRFYQDAACNASARAEVIARSLGTVAFDVPLLLALFLLTSARVDLRETPSGLARLNAKRARLGKRLLLEHIELSAPAFALDRFRAGGANSGRTGPRLHHVRGHIVRRRNTVFWRGPHWRGHMRLGRVRSRTVQLGSSG